MWLHHSGTNLAGLLFCHPGILSNLCLDYFSYSYKANTFLTLVQIVYIFLLIIIILLHWNLLHYLYWMCDQLESRLVNLRSFDLAKQKARIKMSSFVKSGSMILNLSSVNTDTASAVNWSGFVESVKILISKKWLGGANLKGLCHQFRSSWK